MKFEIAKMNETQRPTAPELLEQWLSHSAAKNRDPIAAESEPFYRHFWSTWMAYLLRPREEGDATSAPIKWHEVTAVDVVQFLRSGPEARKETEGVSDITRRRYWRLLQRIYSFAVESGWLAANPVLEIEKDDTPSSEDPLGAIMLAPLWNAALQIVNELDSSDPVFVRNKALLLLLFQYGITPQEARLLTVQAVTRITNTSSPRFGQIATVQLDGPGPNQRRRLVLTAQVADAIDAWLKIRPSFPKAQTHTILFCTARNPTMSADNLFALVKAIMKQAAAASGMDMPVRMGPQVVRNTRLVRWLEEGVPAPEVAMRAGLKNVKGLFHLRMHVNAEIRTTLRNVRDDAPVQLQLQLRLTA